MIQNPYIVGNPIEDSRMFFGRVDDFAYLATKMAGADRGGMFVLCGTRRSGKTSVLFQILKGRLGADFLPALVDMQSYAADGDAGFVRLMATKIAAAADQEKDDDLALFDQADLDFTTLREAFIAYCRRIRTRSGQRNLVLMFDEYELFEEAIGEGRLSRQILDLFGDLVRGDSGIFLVMAGSTKLEERDAGFWAPCLSQSLHRRISFLSRNDALRLICEPVADLLQYEADVPDRILSLGAGQPFYTQVLCQGLVDRLNETDKTTASAADVDQVVQEIVDNPLPHMIFTWGSLSDVEKVALSAMAEISRPGAEPVAATDILQHLKTEKTGITLATDALSEALEHLFVEDLLSKDEAGDRYAFRMGLWHRWVARMHSVWQVLEEIKAEDRKPQPGIIRLARRRLVRTLWAVALVAVAVGLWFLNKAMEAPVLLDPVAPDSTLLSFHTEPAGARFFLADHLLGTAPQDSLKVPAGRFEYRVEMDGFRVHTDSLTLAPDTFLAVADTLVEMTGSLEVVTSPGQAEVTVDGRVWPDPTPTLVHGLTARDLHQIRLRRTGFMPVTLSNFQVVADSTIRVTHDFRRPRHPLTIVTRPTGAAVTLAGTPHGPAPLSLPSVEAGAHTLLVQLEGYYDLERTVTVPTADDRVECALEPLPPGLVQLRVQPYAEIYVNGTLVGSGMVFHDALLAVGRHTVEFVHPTFGNHRQEVNVTTGDTILVRHNFGGGP